MDNNNKWSEIGDIFLSQCRSPIILTTQNLLIDCASKCASHLNTICCIYRLTLINLSHNKRELSWAWISAKFSHKRETCKKTRICHLIFFHSVVIITIVIIINVIIIKTWLKWSKVYKALVPTFLFTRALILWRPCFKYILH